LPYDGFPSLPWLNKPNGLYLEFTKREISPQPTERRCALHWTALEAILRDLFATEGKSLRKHRFHRHTLGLPEMADTVNPIHAIRTAEPRDAAELARLLTRLGHPTSAVSIAERWAAWVDNGNAALVATAQDGAIIGAVTLHQMTVLHRPMPVGRITALIVDGAVRGFGVGRALVTEAERVLADAGCGLLEITSNSRLTDAHAFYEHLGYCQTSVRFAKDLLSKNTNGQENTRYM
jgi:GNAT superfamily N-acetyltransferase